MPRPLPKILVLASLLIFALLIWGCEGAPAQYPAGQLNAKVTKEQKDRKAKDDAATE
jgi:hypothetical protein